MSYECTRGGKCICGWEALVENVGIVRHAARFVDCECLLSSKCNDVQDERSRSGQQQPSSVFRRVGKFARPQRQ